MNKRATRVRNTIGPGESVNSALTGADIPEESADIPTTTRSFPIFPPRRHATAELAFSTALAAREEPADLQAEIERQK